MKTKLKCTLCIVYIGKAALRALIKMSGSAGNLYKRPFTVCVEGNIGSGKTTFLSHFKKFDNITVLEEPVELWRDVSGANLLVSEKVINTGVFFTFIQLFISIFDIYINENK